MIMVMTQHPVTIPYNDTSDDSTSSNIILYNDTGDDSTRSDVIPYNDTGDDTVI
jgi:hypothetical protein